MEMIVCCNDNLNYQVSLPTQQNEFLWLGNAIENISVISVFICQISLAEYIDVYPFFAIEDQIKSS